MTSAGIRGSTVGLLLFLVAPVRPAPLEILYDGDVRGVLGGPRGRVARAHATARRRRAGGRPVVLLSTGSVLGPSPTSEVDGGAAAVRLMNQIGYDAMALGRKDFFDGKENLVERLSRARFPVLATNLELVGADAAVRARWRRFRDWVHVERGDARVRVYGALSPAATSYGPAWDPEVKVGDLRESLETARFEARAVGEADLEVLLATMGFLEAVRLVRALPWLDLVLCNPIGVDEFLEDDGFEYRFRDGRRILWTQVLGGALGRIVVEGTGEARSFETDPLSLDATEEEDPAARAVVDAAREEAAAALSGEVGTLTEAEREDFARAVANALRVELDREVGLLHEGSFHVDVPPARLTRQSLRESYPHTDHGATVSMKGAELARLWRERSSSLDPERHLVFAGVEERAGKVLVNGRLLRPGDTYRVATLDFLTLGGFGPLLTGKGEVVPVRTVTLLERYFARPDRAARTRALERRTVVRHRTTVDVTLTDLTFGGSAPQFQFQEPATLSRGSDIPRLVGLENETLSASLDHTTTLDRRRSDLIFDLSLAFSQIAPNGAELKALDRASFTTRLEEKRPLRAGPTRYLSLDLDSTLEDVELAGRERPLFARVASGLLWRRGVRTKLYAGLGWVARFSTPGDPKSLGLNLGYETSRDLHERITWSSKLDGLVSADDDQVRTADWRNELRFRITGDLTTVLRYNYFLWDDSTVREPATRTETYLGIGVDLTRRRH